MYKLNTENHDFGSACFHLPSQGVVSWFLHVACHVEKDFKYTAGPSKNGRTASYIVLVET